MRTANSASACGFQRGRSPRTRRGSVRRSRGLTSPELFRASSNQLLCWDPAVKGSNAECPFIVRRDAENGPRAGRLGASARAVLVLCREASACRPFMGQAKIRFGRCLSGTRQFDGTRIAANRLHTLVYLSWSQTMQRRRIKHSRTREEGLAEESKRLREQANHLPMGHEREALLKRASLADTASHLSEWLTSPGLQPPKA